MGTAYKEIAQLVLILSQENPCISIGEAILFNTEQIGILLSSTLDKSCNGQTVRATLQGRRKNIG